MFARFIWTSHATFVGNHAGIRGLRDGAKPTPSHIHPTTNHTLHTQQAPRPRPPSDLPTFTNLHATHGYTTLPGPHQTPRPRIRTTHALKTQTTSPKTPHIRSISPKWSALWAHPSPTPSIWRQQQGLRDCRSVRERRSLAGQRADAPGHAQRYSAAGVEGAGGSGGPGRASRRGAERSEALASRAAGPDGARNTRGTTSSLAQQLPDNGYDSETSPATTSPRGSRRARPR